MENKVKIITPFEAATIDLNDVPIFKASAYKLISFDDVIIAFLDKFSKSILSNKLINNLPEITALGFWLRRKNIEDLKNKNHHLINDKNYVVAPIGKVLHICPANVDTMFLYSLAVSLLMGNKNILRVSKRSEEPSIKEIFRILNLIIAQSEFEILSQYINIISYDHSVDISNQLSKNVNARLLWGGDNTIDIFKKFETSPRNKDIVFADRVSLLVINCNFFLALNELEEKDFMKKFYNDCYTFDQMGCSSAQTIFFVGNDDEYKTSLHKLASALDEYLISNYNNDLPSIASLKFNRIVDDSINKIITAEIGTGYIKLLTLANDADIINLHSCGAGYFYTKQLIAIDEMINCNNKKIQTIAYFGITKQEKNHLIALANGEGIDRIVPLGKALDFNYIWDGYNLFDELSKKIQVL